MSVVRLKSVQFEGKKECHARSCVSNTSTSTLALSVRARQIVGALYNIACVVHEHAETHYVIARVSFERQQKSALRWKSVHLHE